MADLFEHRNQVHKQAEFLRHILAEGNIKEDKNDGWFVPHLLNETVSHITYHFEQFAKNTKPLQRDAKIRNELECKRLKFFHQAFEFLKQKYKSAQRTSSLFRAIESGDTRFVLILRSFSARAHYLQGVSYVEGQGAVEKFELNHLANKLAPIPLVKITNPAESEFITQNSNIEQQIFNVDAGNNWKEVVSRLVYAASSIIYYNPQETEGILHEVGIVQRLGREADSYYLMQSGSDDSIQSLGARKLTDDTINKISLASTARVLEPGLLPDVTCLWLDGQARKKIESEIQAASNIMAKFELAQQEISADFILDICYYMAGGIILLERLDLLVHVIDEIQRIIRQIPVDKLPEGPQIADYYSQLLNNLVAGMEQVPPEAPLQEMVARVLLY